MHSPDFLRRASLVAQLVKNSLATREIWVQSLGWEDSLEKGTATHFSILAWKIPWTVQSVGSQRVRTGLSDFHFHFSSVQLLSRFRLLATPWTAARQASLSVTNSWSLLKLMSIELVMPSNHLILCCPLLLPPSTFPNIRVFSSESALCIRWPKYWSFSFSISPSNEYSGLISCLLQHHSSKTSILRHSAFFLVQLSHPYMTTGKTTGLDGPLLAK